MVEIDERVSEIEYELRALRTEGPKLTGGFKWKILSWLVWMFVGALTVSSAGIGYVFNQLTESAAQTAVTNEMETVRVEIQAEAREVAVQQAIRTSTSISKEVVVADLKSDPHFVQGLTRQLQPVPDGAVIISTVECDQITQGRWSRYEMAAGRFLVSVGAGTDVQGVTKVFSQGQSTNSGEYEHMLSESEFPSHTHSMDQKVNTTGGHRPGHPIFDTAEETSGKPTQISLNSWGAEKGKQKPVVLLPPYIALHFCMKSN